MTWFDLAMLAVLALSALLAFFRGFVREVLGVGAWIGAIIIAYWFFPFVSPKFEQWIKREGICRSGGDRRRLRRRAHRAFGHQQLGRARWCAARL